MRIVQAIIATLFSSPLTHLSALIQEVEISRQIFYLQGAADFSPVIPLSPYMAKATIRSSGNDGFAEGYLTFPYGILYQQRWQGQNWQLSFTYGRESTLFSAFRPGDYKFSLQKPDTQFLDIYPIARS